MMKKFHLGLAASASALLLVACGGGATDDASEPAAETEAPAETTTEAAAEEEAPAAPAADDVATVDGTTLADFTGDAAAGEKVFIQCQACHVLDEGVNRVGPSLAGIVGRTAGSVEGFNYTDANANSGITWTPEKMFQYLENPQRVIPGTRMAFAGLKDGQDRADIIAYLQAN
ncbi:MULTISPECIES: cytochrome c family protein [Altererythrobacter]|uniref:Cytochrome c n=2 Tax=Altererythrobacter TaxID=361177 RepID=A0A562UMD1_9SPHN|nr:MULTISPECIES: cytochrome c family protein [Altererythrobacter]TWJ06783.1 cytochrome c [Altererythrobacter ishigakiensis]